jgi:hypothetical protein
VELREKSMFDLFFGLFWCAMCGVMTFIFYGTDMPIEFNGILMEHDKFMSTSIPHIFTAIFWIIGLWLLSSGIYKTVRNMRTSVYGDETYGIIVDIKPSNNSINDRPVLEATVALLDGNAVIELTESIGVGQNKYATGDLLRVKCYKNDINILDTIARSEVPSYALEILDTQYLNYHIPNHNGEAKYITINGHRYKKVD